MSSEKVVWTAKAVNTAMEKSGFNEKERNIMSKLSANQPLTDDELEAVQVAFDIQRQALVITEIAEGIEAIRKGRTVRGQQLLAAQTFEELVPVWKLDPENPEDVAYYAKWYKDTLEDELADADIRMRHWNGLKSSGEAHEAHVLMKMAVNASRPRMHGKKC